jgi:hypothetical protein
VTFSIIVATKGRRTLIDALASITPQLKAGDEVLIVRSDHRWGHQARNEAMPRCRGTHLLFADDDDKTMKGALDLIREKVGLRRRKVHLFCMAYPNGVVIRPCWPPRLGHIGTPMMCVPRTRRKVGVWSERYEGDFDFLESTMLLRGDLPVLHDDVVALISMK